MAPLCTSGLLVLALGIALVATDIYHHKTRYIPEHSILMGLVAALFFTMCNYGYEMVNWVFLGIIPIYIFLKWIFSLPSEEEPEEYEECYECQKPKKTCGCPKKRHHREHQHVQDDIYNKKRHDGGCPANPIRLESECGISRYNGN